jgi:hypothetical protein
MTQKQQWGDEHFIVMESHEPKKTCLDMSIYDELRPLEFEVEPPIKSSSIFSPRSYVQSSPYI